MDFEEIRKEVNSGDEKDSSNEISSDIEDQTKSEIQIKRVNFISTENKVESFSRQTSEDTSAAEDFIVSYKESDDSDEKEELEDTFDEAIRETKKEPTPGFRLRRAPSRAAPGTVKKLMARFQNQ